MYALFDGTLFLTSERGVRNCGKYYLSDRIWSALLRSFLLHLLEFFPSQLPTIMPLLMRIGDPRIKSAAVSILLNNLPQLLPLLPNEGKQIL